MKYESQKSLIFCIFRKIVKRRSKKYSIMKHPYPLAYDLSRREYLPSKRVSLKLASIGGQNPPVYSRILWNLLESSDQPL